MPALVLAKLTLKEPANDRKSEFGCFNLQRDLAMQVLSLSARQDIRSLRRFEQFVWRLGRLFSTQVHAFQFAMHLHLTDGGSPADSPWRVGRGINIIDG